MLENLLTWTQSQFREVKFEPVSLLLTEELEAITEQLQQQAKQKNVSLNVLIPTHLCIQADMQMLHVILRNLISNAIKFSEAGQLVTIGAL